MRLTTSDPQREAARTNGAKSHGPTTPEGKARASQNSIRHGLDSKTVVLANESRADYDRLLAQYHHEWQPQGQTEVDLTKDMVDARWRLIRIRAMEAATIDSEMFIQRQGFDAAFSVTTAAMRQADAFLSVNLHNAPAAENLAKYEARYERSFDRARRALIQMQQLRGVEPAETSPEADEPQPTPPVTWLQRLIAWLLALLPAKPRRKRQKRGTVTRNLTPFPGEPAATAPNPEEFEWESAFTKHEE